MSEIELQDGCTFTANVIGTQLLLSLPDSTPHASGDTIVLENGVQYIPIYLPEALPSSNVVSSYVINDSQLPLLDNSRQIILTEDQIVALNQVSTSSLPQNEFSQQILCLNADEDHNDAECDDNRNVTVTIEAEEESSSVSAVQVSPDDIVDPPDKTGPKVCDTCSLRFESRKLFKKHVLSHLHEKPFKCPHCPESFNHEYNFIPHVAIHNVKNPTCPVCNKRFSRLAGLKAHILIHQCDDTLPCPECLEEFSSQKLLEAHRLEHKSGFVKTAGKTQNCAICEEKFSTKALLKEHVHDAHKVKIPKKVKKGKGGYVCEFCKKRFEKPSQLVRHRRTHTGEKPFKCAECGKGFGQKGSLQIHMLKHSGVRPYACKYCSSQFSQKGNLQAHIQRIHPEEKDEMRKMHCKYCSCVFRNIVALHTHMSRNHGVYISSKKGKTITYHVKENTIIADVVIDKDTSNKENEAKAEQPVETSINNDEVLLSGTEREQKLPRDVINKCKQCSRVFGKRADLVKHLKMHSEEKLTCDLMCVECGHSFKHESLFLTHIKTAHPPLEFSCDLCPDKFATLDLLKSHRAKHLEKHQCKDCQMSFDCEEALRAHEERKKIEASREKEVHPKTEEAPVECVTSILGDMEIEGAKLLLSADGFIEVIHDEEPSHVEETGNEPQAAEELPEAQEVIEEPTRENHDETRKYKCDHCNMAFKQLSHWKTHLRIHTGERPFSCSTCQKSFASKSALTAHLATHELPSYCCEDCGKAFSSSRSLKRHMELHVLGFPYSCSVCLRSYKTKVAWQKHLTTHIKINPQQHELQGKSEAEGKSTQVPENCTEPASVTEPEILRPDKGSIGNKKDVPSSSSSSSSFQGDWNDLMQSLQPSQHFGFTGNQNYQAVSASTSIKTVATSTSPQESITTVRFGELGGKPQLLTPLSDQAFDGCVFLQNSGDLQSGAQNITSSVPTVSSQPQLTSSHRCSLCNVSFDNLVALSIHKTTHVQDKWSSCHTCDTVFSSYQVLQAHKKDCKPTEAAQQEETNQDYLCVDLLSTNLHECETCSIHFFQANDYVNHVNAHHGAYACKSCSLWFKTSGQLEVHQLCHKLSPTGDVRDSESDESSGSKKLTLSNKPISIEVNLDSGSERKSTTSSSKERLELKRKRAAWRRQAIRTLTEEEQDEVTKANPSSISERILQQSILRLKAPRPEPEAGVYPNQCKYCPKSFRKPSDLVRHLRVHTGERPYTCTSCNKSFSIKSTANSHIKIHKKERTYSCHICHNHFAAIGSLKVHMRLHTGAKPFACDFCPARFRTSGHRKSHLLSHLRKDSNSNAKAKLVIPLSEDLTAPPSPGRRKSPSPSLSVDFLSKPDDSGDFVEHSETDPLEPSKQLSSSQFLFSLNAPLEFVDRSEAPTSQQFFLKEVKGNEQAGTAAHFVVTMTDDMSYQDNINDLLESVPNLNDHEDRFKLDLDLDVSKEQLRGRVCEACTVCGKGFNSELELDSHMKKEHFSSSLLSCNVCKQTFTAKTDLELHILVHELDHLSCHSCSLGFSDESALRKHKCSNEDSNMKSMPSAPLDLASVVNEFFSFPAL